MLSATRPSHKIVLMESSKMSATFSDYAEYYDLLYKDKDYKKEAEYVVALIRKFHLGNPGGIHILDLACGTGRHAFELENMGFSIEGSDHSQSMIERARAAARERGGGTQFYNHSFQTAGLLGKKYDVIISMFSAINYLVTYRDFSLAMQNIGSLLAENGIFVFDYWNGNAVLRDHSPSRVLRKRAGDMEVVRTSETTIDPREQLARVRFTFLCLKNSLKKAEFEEIHHIRYFHFKEMETLLNINGFQIVYISPFMNLDKPVQPYDWNISVVAKKT